MFPNRTRICSGLRSFLCMCRDVSRYHPAAELAYIFSLHVQRCFLQSRLPFLQPLVFSACAEMFPFERGDGMDFLGFLCVCRDVSGAVTAISAKRLFSLRMQRCFRRVSVDGLTTSVFSAHTEMFPGTAESAPGPVCFICISRDVSALSQPMRSVMGCAA